MTTLTARSKCSPVCGHGGCYACGLKWCQVDSHTTVVRNGSGLFPLCVECWRLKTPEERLPFFRQVHEYHSFLDRRSGHESMFTWEEIERAVLSEPVDARHDGFPNEGMMVLEIDE